MNEATYAEPITIPATVEATEENSTQGNIASRKTIVYKTLIDPAVLRITSEKNKCRLFNDSLFWRYRPEEIEFVSMEKYYEPYIAVNGKYFIDYYRQNNYSVKVGREVKEVVLLNQTLLPEQVSNSTSTEHRIKIQVEERLLKEKRAFLFLTSYGQDANLKEFPSGPSENNPDQLIKDFNMQEIAPNMDVDLVHSRIADRPYDAKRIVSEVFQIDERSIIYAPRFKFTYKCLKTGKQATLEFDGVTAKPIKQKENIVLATTKRILAKLKEVLL